MTENKQRVGCIATIVSNRWYYTPIPALDLVREVVGGVSERKWTGGLVGC